MMLPAEHPISALVRKASADPLQGPSHTEAAGLIAWLSEFGAVLIPSFGFFIRSQEFFRTLMAGDTPAGGSLAALGFPDEKVRRFSSQADNAGVLLYLSCGEQTKTGSVLELLRGTGAEETGVLSTDGAVPVAA